MLWISVIMRIIEFLHSVDMDNHSAWEIIVCIWVEAGLQFAVNSWIRFQDFGGRKSIINNQFFLVLSSNLWAQVCINLLGMIAMCYSILRIVNYSVYKFKKGSGIINPIHMMPEILIKINNPTHILHKILTKAAVEQKNRNFRK